MSESSELLNVSGSQSNISTQDCTHVRPQYRNSNMIFPLIRTKISLCLAFLYVKSPNILVVQREVLILPAQLYFDLVKATKTYNLAGPFPDLHSLQNN